MLAAQTHPRSDVHDAPLHLRLLGTFHVTLGDIPIDPSRWRLRKAAAIIKLLALEPSRQMHQEQLVDILWPEADPETAGANLRRTLYIARNNLGRHGEVSRWLQRRGELLVLGPRELVKTDVEAFETAAARAFDTRDLILHRQAVAGYNGDLLPSDRYEPWSEPRRSALRASYLALLERLAGLYENDDEFGLAIEMWQRLLALDPAHEDAHIRLMQIFAATGQRRRALAQYQYLRDGLQRELDSEPTPASSRLYEQILRGQLPDTVMSISRPTPVHPPQRNTDPLPRVADVVLTNLPAQLTSFVGRDQEIDLAHHLLDPRRHSMPNHLGPHTPASRLVTLTGTGGSGKTRLGLEVAARLLRAFPDGVWLVELATLADPATVGRHILAALPHVPDQAGVPPETSLIQHFANRHALLILDNCEHLVDGVAELAARLLVACPQLTILATSREALRVPGERCLPVPALTLPGYDVASIEALLKSQSAQLFVDRARAIQPGFALTDAEADALGRICHTLEGLPLALELAAARVKLLTLGQIDALLVDSLQLLTDGARTVHPRQRSLRATLDWSYGLLAADEQILLRRVAVFAGGWSLEATVAVCTGPDLPAADVLDGLAHLVDKSLVEVDESGEQARYRLLEPVHQFAAERLDGAGETAQLRDLHVAWCVDLAERLHHGYGESHAGSRRLTSQAANEAENLRAALRWCRDGRPGVSPPQPATGLRLALGLYWFWQDRRLEEGRAWLEQFLSAATAAGEPVPSATQCRAWWNIGYFSCRLGDYATAAAAVVEQRNLALASDDRASLLHAVWTDGIVARDQGDLLRAIEDFTEALTLARELDRPSEISQCLVDLGATHSLVGDYSSAIRRLQEAVAVCRAWDHGTGREMLALGELGGALLGIGDLDEARGAIEASLVGNRLRNWAWGILESLRQLGRLEHLAVDPVLALAAWGECLEQCHATGERRYVPDCLDGIASAAAALGEAERGAQLLGAANALRVLLGVVRPPSDWAAHAATLDVIEASLSPAVLESVVAEGRSLEFDAMVALGIETVAMLAV